MTDDEHEPGTCSVGGCECCKFTPKKGAPMRCGVKKCGHSIEWHNIPAREIDV